MVVRRRILIRERLWASPADRAVTFEPSSPGGIMRLPRPLSFSHPVGTRRPGFDRAIQLLRDGRVNESAYGQRVALLLTIPVVDDPVARDIRRTTAGELYVVRTVWQRAVDLATPRPPRVPSMIGRPLALGIDAPLKPTLVSTQVPVDVRVLEGLLDTLDTITVACRARQAEPPLDATVVELTLGDELAETRYRWAGDPPDGWDALATFTTRLLRLVDDTPGARHR